MRGGGEKDDAASSRHRQEVTQEVCHAYRGYIGRTFP